jgi:hypothetical protein
LLIKCECGIMSRVLFRDSFAAVHAGGGRSKGKRRRCLACRTQEPP